MTQEPVTAAAVRCARCGGAEWVCGAHPDRPSATTADPDRPVLDRLVVCGCAPGVPCPDCHPAGQAMGDDLGPHVAWEPSTLPNRPLTAADAAPFIEKEVG